mmetsp:Transcript_5366/g.9658  ORF Transcript_5366/g.9658 Transcript_5366/m.9658 type:complete len:230 (+) Transcript_5366:1614-2303(+)
MLVQAIHVAKKTETVPATDILHDNVKVVLTLKAVVEAHDEWVACGCKNVALVLDTLHHILAHQVRFPHHFDGEQVLCGFLPSQVDSAKRSSTDRLNDFKIIDGHRDMRRVWGRARAAACDGTHRQLKLADFGLDQSFDPPPNGIDKYPHGFMKYALLQHLLQRCEAALTTINWDARVVRLKSGSAARNLGNILNVWIVGVWDALQRGCQFRQTGVNTRLRCKAWQSNVT